MFKETRVQLFLDTVKEKQKEKALSFNKFNEVKKEGSFIIHAPRFYYLLNLLQKHLPQHRLFFSQFEVAYIKELSPYNYYRVFFKLNKNDV